MHIILFEKIFFSSYRSYETPAYSGYNHSSENHSVAPVITCSSTVVTYTSTYQVSLIFWRIPIKLISSISPSHFFFFHSSCWNWFRYFFYWFYSWGWIYYSRLYTKDFSIFSETRQQCISDIPNVVDTHSTGSTSNYRIVFSR